MMLTAKNTRQDQSSNQGKPEQKSGGEVVKSQLPEATEKIEISLNGQDMCWL